MLFWQTILKFTNKNLNNLLLISNKTNISIIYLTSPISIYLSDKMVHSRYIQKEVTYHIHWDMYLHYTHCLQHNDTGRHS